MKLSEQLDEDIRQWLNEHDVTISFPRSRMVQLDGVGVGEGFSKPFTNLLLRQLDNEAGRWDVYVDEDFYYVGNDAERRGWFCGQKTSRWSRLQLARPISGDVNGAIVQALDLVESPVLKDVAEPVVKRLLETPPADNTQPGTECPLDRERSTAPPIKLTHQQLDAVERIAVTVCRRMPPTCPLLLGASGSGKSALAQAAARTIRERGVVRRVISLSGADVSCGAVFQAQRDDCLRDTLKQIRDRTDTLVVMEHFELACCGSPVAASLICDALDDGLRMIAIANPGGGRHVTRYRALTRRLEPIRVPPLEPADLRQLLEDQAANHPLGGEVDVSPEVLPVVLELAQRRRGANPGSALSLMDAVVTHANWADAKFVGPDDVYHVAQAPPE
jgi:hypothetical protein